MPSALESFDLRGYDLVISSESGPAKGVLAPSTARHVCYCHTPMRYLWELYPAYLHEWTRNPLKRAADAAAGAQSPAVGLCICCARVTNSLRTARTCGTGSGRRTAANRRSSIRPLPLSASSTSQRKTIS